MNITNIQGKVYIFGAKSTAIGVIRALRAINRTCEITGVLVSSLADNPHSIEGISVRTLRDVADSISDNEKQESAVIIATPVFVQNEINDALCECGFKKIIPLDTYMEAKLMDEYYQSIGLFPSIRCSDLKNNEESVPKTCVLEVCHFASSPMEYQYKNEEWDYQFIAGTPTSEQIASFAYESNAYDDNSGDNIADKNGLYCELTAYYWAWKNLADSEYEYLGISHYRRHLDIDARDLMVMKREEVDVILPYPMLHVPNIKEQHTRYTNEAEWNALLEAVAELEPEYYSDYERIFASEYMYNYNMMIAKKSVFIDYCKWLFPILYRTEEIVKEKGINPAKRYLAYYGESLLTLYFMHNKDNIMIRHTGRLLRK